MVSTIAVQIADTNLMVNTIVDQIADTSRMAITTALGKPVATAQISKVSLEIHFKTNRLKTLAGTNLMVNTIAVLIVDTNLMVNTIVVLIADTNPMEIITASVSSFDLLVY